MEYTDNDTIFVSIASYRDNKCSMTIESLFNMANKPNNIWVGVCEQNNKKHDKPCISPKWESRIRYIRIPHWDAKGPTWARYLCTSLIDNEKYFLQIDSHSLFAKDWDLYLVKTIKQLEQMGFQKSILSHYIRSDKYYNESQDSNYNSIKKIPTICSSKFNTSGIITLNAAHDIEITDERPKPNAYIAGGMIFGKTKFIEEVPYDPDLPNLFVGEEILYSARLWTHGWNIFTPTKNVIYHFYIRNDEPKYWSGHKGGVDDSDALIKLKYLLKLENIDKNNINKHLKKNLDVYGLGKERTLEQYYYFAGIIPDSQNGDSNTNFCKKSNDELYDMLKRVPNTLVSNEFPTNFKYKSSYCLEKWLRMLIIILIMLLFIMILLKIFYYKKKSNRIKNR